MDIGIPFSKGGRSLMSSILLAQLIVRRTIGTRKGFLLFILLPIVVISSVIGIFGKAVDHQAHIAVWNGDTGSLGQSVVRSIQSVDLYQVVPAGQDESSQQGLKDAVYEGRRDAAVYIPANFSEKLLAGERPVIEMYRKNEQLWNAALQLTIQEETDRLARTVQMAAAAGGDKMAQELLVQQLLDQQNNGGVHVTPTQITLPSDNTYVLVIGMMLMFLMFLSNQSIHNVMEDRENRTMARMFTAPVRAWEIALGNFVGCVMLGTLQLVLILITTHYFIGFDFGLPFGMLLLIMESFLLAAVGLSSAVSGLVRNTAQLGNLNNLVVIPTCMLGGCFWPVSMMPEFMQKLSNFTPQKWAIYAIEQTSAGASLPDVGVALGILLLFAAVLLAFGSYVLQPAKN
jgi:ABC-2 type transport system permease protein